MEKANYKEIIANIEQVRKDSGLNKFKFAGKMKMCPQTYNNFVGSQGSKPSLDLIYGVISTYNVDPLKLLGIPPIGEQKKQKEQKEQEERVMIIRGIFSVEADMQCKPIKQPVAGI